MADLAYACVVCRTLTVFGRAALFPRLCLSCGAVVRGSATGNFVARPVYDEDEDVNDRLSLELPVCNDIAPF